MTQIPGSKEQPIDRITGQFSLPWRRWLDAVNVALNAAGSDTLSLTAAIATIATALGSPDGTVANIPDQDSLDVVIVGRNGITVTGKAGVSPVVVELQPLEDAGTGTFKLLERDDYGRLSGTVDGTAADVPYDNTASGLTATDVQAAIDEVAASGGGGGAAGVYWNPADKDSKLGLYNSDATVLRSTTSDGTWCAVRGLTSHNSGKWYAECQNDFNGSSNGSMIFGLADASFTLTGYVGSDTHSWGIQANNTTVTIYTNASSSVGSGMSSLTAHGGRAMVAYNATLGYIWLGTMGTWHNNGNPATGTNPTYTTTPGTTLFLALSQSNSPEQCTLRNNHGEALYGQPADFAMWG